MATWKKAVLGATVALFALCLLEGGLSLLHALRGFGAVETMHEAVHTEHDPELGWVNLKNFHDPDLYGDGRGYTTNGQGFRAKEPYSPAIPPNTYRVIALGDSFTMGYGVGHEDTYPAQLEQLSPNTQVINMGMGGYGLGQDYLWYLRDGQELEADLLLFAFIAHDFERLVLTSFMGYEKPRVGLSGEEIRVENTPVPGKSPLQDVAAGAAIFLERLALGKALAALLRPLQAARQHEEYVGFEAPAAAIFEALRAHSRKVGQDFVLVYLPTLYGIRGAPEPPHEWLRAHAEQADLTLIDLTPAFEQLTPRELGSMYIPGDAHYSPKGNRFVARELKRALTARLPEFAAIVAGGGQEGRPTDRDANSAPDAGVPSP